MTFQVNMEKTNAQIGDYVEIHFSKLIYEGVLVTALAVSNNY